jgi:hypothetical protein
MCYIHASVNSGNPKESFSSILLEADGIWRSLVECCVKTVYNAQCDIAILIDRGHNIATFELLRNLPKLYNMPRRSKPLDTS